MTKPLTPTLGICLAASAVMVGALFVEPDKPQTKAYDETTASESVEPTPSSEAPYDFFSPTPTTEPAEPQVPTPQSTPSATPSTTATVPSTPTPTYSTPTTTPTSPPSTTSSPTSTPTTTDPTTPDSPGTGGGGGDGSVYEPKTVKVRITGMSLPDIKAEPGATIKVVNDDAEPHTVTKGGGRVTTGDIPPGEFRTFVAPVRLGDYRVFCEYHKEMMSATLTVRRQS